MSADNWRVCPRCTLRTAKKVAEVYAEVNAAYGKIDASEYLDKLKTAQALAAERPEETLREDYGLGIDEDGEFSVSYRGGCDECGLVFSFEHTAQVPLEEEHVKGGKRAKANTR